MKLTDLPIDIILVVFPYLDAEDFLAFTSCCSGLLSHRHEATYWRSLTRSTFRIPPQPLLETNGAHWQRLYKKLRTQTHVYTWGSNTSGNLGHDRRPRTQNRQRRMRGTKGWPQEMAHVQEVGIVADVQCGGWSTVLLNATGQLWAVGTLNGMTHRFGYDTLHPLVFPPAYPASSSSRYEPATAVQQFSIGRYRALALSDDHKVWEWPSFDQPAQMIKFFNVDNDPSRSKIGEGKVTKVVAGWSLASAYIEGAGIIYWRDQPENSRNDLTDALIVLHCSVPGTAFRRNHFRRTPSTSVEVDIGEIRDFVCLDRYIVFTTHTKKLFAWCTDHGDDQPHCSPLELTQFYQDNGPCIESVQGSFIKFGVFTTNGAVLIGTKDVLDKAWSEYTISNVTTFDHIDSLMPAAPSALQHSSVVSLAFGDYHYHALHSDGSLTSYGTESQACGSLGLGDNSISHLRGVYSARRNTDGQLQIPPWSDGRRTIWFEEEKQQWIFDTCQKGATNEASARRLRSVEDPDTISLMGEWFEREGRNWSKGPQGDQPEPNDDGIDAFFALKVAAAGHSSAALVLVNEEKAARVRMKYVTEQPEFLERDPGGLSKPRQIPPQTLLESTGHYIFDVGRWMLGLTERDDRERASQQTEMTPEESKKARADAIRYGSTYVWEHHPFPRLKYPDGTAMPGSVEFTEWKSGEPDFGNAVTSET